MTCIRPVFTLINNDAVNSETQTKLICIRLGAAQS
jgi:hypothetical protein